MFESRPHRVAILALDAVMVFDLGIAERIFESAHAPGHGALYEVEICSISGAPVRTSAGELRTEHGLELLKWADTVVIPSLRDSSDLLEGAVPLALRTALVDAAGRARLMSICTGAFVLAAAGLLDGRRATTHWLYADRFRSRFPRVALAPEVLFVDDGDILTSAGGGAGIDLCLHVVRRDHGSEAANRAARNCVVPPWRHGGQSQYIERPVPELSSSSTSEARAWALEHLHEPLDLVAMARFANMSVRTFTRRFRSEVGMSPAQWLLERRVERARQLLETTNLPIERIGRETGFGTASAFRTRFKDVVGVPPRSYRETFQHTVEPARDSVA